MRTWITWTTIAIVIMAGGLLTRPVDAFGTAESLTISPVSDTITADESIAFKATVIDGDDNTKDVTATTTWSMNDPLGSLSGATYHAGKVGIWTVQAEFESFIAQAEITVTAGTLKELVINPNSEPEFVTLDAQAQFTVQGYDIHNNVVTGFTPKWSVIGDLGTISQAGLFTATKIGNGKIQATVDKITAQIAIVVKAVEINVNANVNANANTNTAANQNGNANVNGNVNNNDNANQNDNANANVNAAGKTDTAKTADCETLSTWVWVMIMIVFLLGLAILYALVPVMKIWPAIAGLGGAIALIAIHRAYGCELLTWWDWVMALGTLGLSVMAMRQLPTPKSTP